MRFCLVILVVVIGLWLSGLFMGSCQGEATLPDRDQVSDLSQHIQGWMPTPSPLTKADLEPAACLDFPYLRPSDSSACTVEIREGDDTRATVIKLEEGTARVAFTDKRRPNKSWKTNLPAEAEGETVEELQLQISSDGGELIVHCREGKSCAVRLKPKTDG
jgi:hypothetical protein